MAQWTLNSLVRGVTFYITAIFATIYVLLRPFPRSFLSWVYRRQAERRDWHGLHSLPPYKHKRKAQHANTTKQYLHGDKLVAEQRYWSLQQCPVQQKTYITPDGLSVNYYIIYPGNPKTFAIANGLGVSRNFVGFAPLIHRYGAVDGDWSFLTWDYRGLFENGDVKQTRKLAVHYHADDLRNIIKQENIKQIDCLVGFSMGVQVVLEFATVYPDLVQKLILCNGSYGNVLTTIYQPICRVPYADTLMFNATQLIIDNVWLFDLVYKPVRAWILFIGYVYSFFLGSPFLRELLGTDYLVKFFAEYIGGVVSSRRHSENYMRLVLEMNAHSVYHHLREIEQPTLIISGLLDPLTPCYLSFEMARLLPNCKHVNVTYSSHFTLLEQPRQALRAIIEHIEGIRFKKLNDKSFVIDYENSVVEAAEGHEADDGLHSAGQHNNGTSTVGKLHHGQNNGTHYKVKPNATNSH